MRIFRSAFSGAAVVAGILALALPGGATAQTPLPDQPGSQIVIGGGGDGLSAAETEDLAAYQAAAEAFQRRGFAGLNSYQARLRRAINRAPASYPAIEQAGDTWIVRSNDLGEGLMLSVMASAAAQNAAAPGARVNVSTQPNVYPMIALLLGSAAVERHKYSEALDLLDRGLAMQPLHWQLLAERISALYGLQRWEEGLKAADEALASGDMLIGMHAAPFHRKRGFGLVELGRLDEAQAAYEESLKDEPDNTTALGELEYIRGLRRGAAPVAGQVIVPPAPSPST